MGVFYYVRAKSHILRELSFLMLDTGVEEFLRQIKKSTYPLTAVTHYGMRGNGFLQNSTDNRPQRHICEK